MRLGPFFCTTLLLSSSFLLTSCSNSSRMGDQPVVIALQGRAMGGEQPITASVIQLYAAGTATDAGASTALLTGPVITTSDGTGQMNSNANAGNDNNQLPPGSFTITGSYTCPSASTPVYLAAIGGNPGGGTNNSQENVLALGQCGSLSSATRVVINEITTVGTVKALAPYMAGYASVGSTSAHAAALAAAFNTATEYVNPASGSAPGPNLPAGYDADSNDLRALANVVQSCVNSTGSTATGQPCGSFFTDAQGSASTVPADTITALLDIFADPTNNVTALFNLQGTTPAFAPTNPSAPADWSLPILQVPATPSISPNGGSFTSVQTVSITDTDTDSTNAIYYTTDGSTPSATNGTLYTGSFTVSSSETVNAIDIDDNRLSSAVATASFTIVAPLPTPTVSLSPVTAVNGQTTPQVITATSNANGSVVTFGTTFPADGTFSPATCTIAAGTCTVYYQPSGLLPDGTYPADLTATFSATTTYAAGAATSTLTITGVTFNSLYSFPNTISGGAMGDTLILASDGNFYGTSPTGGVNGLGSIFRITSNGIYTMLYSFTGGADGSNPAGSLVQASNGLLYGTTATTVFEASLSGSLGILHTFNAATDGSQPTAGLTLGNDGNFYGVTSSGGANSFGTIFQITPSATFTTLYNFTGGTDGGAPFSPLVQGTDGSFYGTAPYGDANGDGAAFKITSSGAFTSLYNFQNGADGSLPAGPLVEGADGNFYGTTLNGGTGAGVIYKITPAGTPTTVYTFQNASDQVGPNAGLFLASDGNFYGTTAAQGYSLSNEYGTIFSLSPSGNLTTLYSFTDGYQDGGNPLAGLVQGSDGSFYGSSFVAPQGNPNQAGNLFSVALSPALTAPIQLTVPAGTIGGNPFLFSYSVANATSDTMKNCFAGLTNSVGMFTPLGTYPGSTTTTNAVALAPNTGGNYTFSLTCGGQETATAPITVIVFSFGAKPGPPTL